MKKYFVIAIVMVPLIYFLYIGVVRQAAQKPHPQEDLNAENGASMRKPPGDASTGPKRGLAATSALPTDDKAAPLTDMVLSHLPKQAPEELKGRFEQVLSFHDDRYVETQLYFDKRPLDRYFYRWAKDSSGAIVELVSGPLPRIEGVEGAFPSESQVKSLVDNAVGTEAEVLSHAEVWNLNSQRILNPQLKVEVMANARSGRRSGHEFWFISVNSGKIVKRIEADRY